MGDDYLKRNEVCNILEEAIHTKEWHPCLKRMKADRRIPPTINRDVINLCRLARVYIGAAHSNIFNGVYPPRQIIYFSKIISKA